MTSLFLSILNMSITASFVAVAVIIARFILRRAPKIFSYMLWSAVAIRLLIPVSFTSNFSVLRLIQPRTLAGTNVVEFVARDMGMQKSAVVDAGMRELSHIINTTMPAAMKVTSVSLMQIILWIGCIVWVTGATIFLLYSVISYLKLLAKVSTATLVKDNIYETDQVATPFVCGFLKPKIYVPSGMSEHELSYILLHEQTHIRRRDYLIKPFAFLMLVVHWFNPLMWLSYSLMSKDMEMSCDESVVGKMGDQIKKSYSTSLLFLAMSRSGLVSGSPLAFGERNVKARIKNILAYRQPSSQKIACYVLVIAVLVVGCTANPKPLSQTSEPIYYSEYQIDKLMKNKTLYVGDASKVGGLISGMPKPEGIQGNGIALQTIAPPYGLTVHYIMDDATAVTREGAISGDAFYLNSVLLLSLIDNVDSITHSIADHTGRYDGAVYSFTFTKERVEQQLGEDVRSYAVDEAGLRRLIDRLESN